MALPVRIDPATLADIYALFEVLITFMGDDWVNVNAYASEDPGGTNLGFQATDKLGNNIGTTLRIVNAKVAITPVSVNLGPGETQQYTASVTLADGSPAPAPAIVWALLPPMLGSLSPAGLYTAPTVILATGQDTVTATYSDGGNATVVVQLHP